MKKTDYLLYLAPWGITALELLLYRGGSPLSLVLFPALMAALFFLSFRRMRSPLALILFGLDLALAVGLGANFSTRLYYEHVSSDWATPVVGALTAIVLVGLALLATLVLTIVRVVLRRKAARASAAELTPPTDDTDPFPASESLQS